MHLKIRSETNFWSGVFFAATGIAAIIMARKYPLGTTLAMGPGYFPTAIGFILAVTGALIAVTGFTVDGEKIDRSFNLRSLVAVCGGLAFFGWGIGRIGFIPSMLGLSFAATVGAGKFPVAEAVLLSVGIAVGLWLIFAVALGLPLKPFW